MLENQPQQEAQQPNKYSNSIIVFVGLVVFFSLPFLLSAIVLVFPFAVLGFIFFGLYRHLSRRKELNTKVKITNNTHPACLKFRYAIHKMQKGNTSVLDKEPNFNILKKNRNENK